MALLLTEGFDNIDAATLSSKGWTASGGPSISTVFGRFSGSQGLSTASNRDTQFYISTASASTVFTGFAIYPVSGGSYLQIFSTYSSGTIYVHVKQNTSTNNLTFYVGSTIVGTTPVSSLPVNNWSYVEIKIVVSPTVGEITCHINGVSQMSLTGINTQNGSNAFINTFLFGSSIDYAASFYLDDFYVCDDTGATNNTFLGDVRIVTLLPDGAGSSTQFTPSAGANYTCVDEVPPDGDTSYVSSSTPGDKDYYTMTNLPYVPGTIFGVTAYADMCKTDAGTRTARVNIQSSSSEVNGPSGGLSTSYAFTKIIAETDPATSSAWTFAGINAVQVGVEVLT